MILRFVRWSHRVLWKVPDTVLQTRWDPTIGKSKSFGPRDIKFPSSRINYRLDISRSTSLFSIHHERRQSLWCRLVVYKQEQPKRLLEEGVSYRTLTCKLLSSRGTSSRCEPFRIVSVYVRVRHEKFSTFNLFYK